MASCTYSEAQCSTRHGARGWRIHEVHYAKSDKNVAFICVYWQAKRSLWRVWVTKTIRFTQRSGIHQQGVCWLSGGSGIRYIFNAIVIPRLTVRFRERIVLVSDIGGKHCMRIRLEWETDWDCGGNESLRALDPLQQSSCSFCGWPFRYYTVISYVRNESLQVLDPLEHSSCSLCGWPVRWYTGISYSGNESLRELDPL